MPYANPETRKEYRKRYYAQHRDEALASAKQYRLDNPEKVRQWNIESRRRDQGQRRLRSIASHRWFAANLTILKEAQGCVDCGTRQGQLNYHHLDPSTKRRNVSKMHESSFESFVDEIGKCVVVCNACHKRRHSAT